MRAKTRPGSSAWAAAGAAALLAGCSTLLGFEELTAIAEDASVPSQDAGSEQAVETEAGTDSAPEDVSVQEAAAESSAPDAPSESCGDTTSDKRNCGACGHDCLAGECLNGECQPAMLIGGLTNPTDIALSGDRVFVVEAYMGGVVRVVNKSGGKSQDFASGTEVRKPCALAVDPQSLFFANCPIEYGDVRRCPLPGGCDTVSPEHLADTDWVGGMLLRDTTLYWTDVGSGHIRKMNLLGEPAASSNVLSSSMAEPDKLVERDGMLYVTDTSPGYSGVYRVSTSGEGMISLFGGRAWGIASGGKYVVWTSEGTADGQVWRWDVAADPEATAPTSIAWGQDDPWDIAADDENAYWVTTGGGISTGKGKVLSVPMASGGQPKLLVPAQASPRRIVVGPDAIYWTNLGTSGGENPDGALMMIAK